MSNRSIIDLLIDERGVIINKDILISYIKEYSHVLRDEDSTHSASDYFQMLMSNTPMEVAGHGRFDLISTYVPSFPEIINRLLKYEAMRLANPGDPDPGGITQYGISYRHILSNVLGSSSALLKRGLLVENQYDGYKFLKLKSIGIGFVYYMLSGINSRKVPTTLDDLLNNSNPFTKTLFFCGFTQFFGFFTYLRSLSDYSTVINRNGSGIAGTNVMSKDVYFVLANYDLGDIIELCEKAPSEIFGTFKRNVIDNTHGEAYRARLIRTLKRNKNGLNYYHS